MTQCNLTQTEQMRRKEIADHTRALVVNLLHVDAEDETSIMCGYRDYYLQISFSELHPLMVFCLAKAITKPNTVQSLCPGLPIDCEAVFALKGAHGAFGRAAVDPVHVPGVVAPIFELGLDLRYDSAARPLFIRGRLSGRNERRKQRPRSDKRRERETQMPKPFVHIENSFADVWV